MTAKRIIGIILIVFGSFFLMMCLIFLVAFLGVGGIMGTASDYEQSQLNEFIDSGAIEVDGTVLSASDGGTMIEYYVEEEETYYTTSLSVSNSEYSEGTVVDVYYAPSNPSDCMIPSLSVDTYEMVGGVFSIAGGIIGVVFAILGIPLLVIGIILVRKSKAQITG